MSHIVFSREILVKLGALALTAAVASPALAGEGRRVGYPGKPAQSTQPAPTTSPAQDQRRQQEEQGEIRPGNPSESQKRAITPVQDPARPGAPGTPTGTPATPSSSPTRAPGMRRAPSAQAGDDVPAITQGTTPNSQLIAPTPLIHFKDVSPERVGVDLSNEKVLTLHEAVEMALQRNLGLESSRFDTQIAGFNYDASKGIYDFNLTSELSFNSTTIPVASIFAGGGSNLAVTRKSLTYNAGFSQLFEHGGTLTGAFNNSRDTTSATSSILNPQYNPQLSVTFAQPILRGYKIDAQRRNIQVAKRNLDLTDAEFRQLVIQTINSVQRAYWDLVYAIRNEQIQRESVDLGRVQLENNLRQIEAGTLAPIELRSTEADLERRKENVITSLQAITIAENTLKGLMLADPGDSMWSARLTPAEPAEFSPIEPDLDSAFRSAVVNRPELAQLKIRTQLKAIDLEYYQDQTKPQLDFIGSYGLQGLAGTEIVRSGGNTGGVDPLTTALITSLNEGRVIAGLPAFDPTPFLGTTGGTTSTVPERFQGSYFRSLGTLLSNDFRTWSVGVRLNLPVQNTTAEANLGRTQAELRQLDVQQRQLVQSIQVEVRNALQAVDAARQRYETSQAARVAAEAQLRGEEEKFRAGLSTNFFVLDRQNQLSDSRGREVQALTDYNKATADLQRVTGTSTVANNVTIEEPTP